MYSDLIHLLAWFALGLGLIVYSGDGFVKSSVQIAEISGIPALYIGTFLVGFSTSVPEIMVTAIAASNGAIDLSIGNVLGSYICNIGLVLGITAIVKPMKISSETLEHAIPLLAVSIIATALLLMIDTVYTAMDGLTAYVD